MREKVTLSGKAKDDKEVQPVKAGSTTPQNIGGIFNAKVAAIVKKIKSKFKR